LASAPTVVTIVTRGVENRWAAEGRGPLVATATQVAADGNRGHHDVFERDQARQGGIVVSMAAAGALPKKSVGAVSDRDYGPPSHNVLRCGAASASETPPTIDFLGKALQRVRGSS
jgi:hypothetical protein